jgi:hypothetical protein
LLRVEIGQLERWASQLHRSVAQSYKPIWRTIKDTLS